MSTLYHVCACIFVCVCALIPDLRRQDSSGFLTPKPPKKPKKIGSRDCSSSQTMRARKARAASLLPASGRRLVQKPKPRAGLQRRPANPRVYATCPETPVLQQALKCPWTAIGIEAERRRPGALERGEEGILVGACLG